MKKYLSYSSAIVLGFFGLITLYLTTSITFDLFGIRAKHGNFVPFIIGVNLLCSLLYLISSYGFFRRKKWTVLLLIAAAVILVIAFIGLKFYIDAGGLYEMKTVGAMIFRISVTIIFAGLAYFTTRLK